MPTDVPNPLVPAAYDVAWAVVTVAILAAIAVVIVLLVRRSRRRREEIAELQADVAALKSRDGGPSAP